jgi:hypothetical protein
MPGRGSAGRWQELAALVGPPVARRQQLGQRVAERQGQHLHLLWAVPHPHQDPPEYPRNDQDQSRLRYREKMAYSHEIFRSTIRVVEARTHRAEYLRSLETHLDEVVNSLVESGTR